MKKTLITGGCGFIGLNLIDYILRTNGPQIVVLDNLSLGRREYLDPYDVEFIEGDIRDEALVARVMRSVSGVIHLAADTRVIESVENPRHNFDVNVVGTFNVLEAARRAGVASFAFASTGGAITGNAEPPVHEEMVPKPISPYGASKLFGEGYLSAYFGAYGMKTIGLRFSNVYGPRSYHKGSVVAQFMKSILANKELVVFGDGSQTRDFVYVDDVCKAIMQAVVSGTGGESYQLGSGVPTSISELLDRIRVAVAPHPFPSVQYLPFRPGEIVHTYTRVDKARRALGYVPSVKFDEGLAKTWEWFVSRARSI